MMSTVRDLYYLAREAADVPVLLAKAIAEGVALGWKITHPDSEGVTITRGPCFASTGSAIADKWLADALADAEAEQEAWDDDDLMRAWKAGELRVNVPRFLITPSGISTSPTDDEQSAQTPAVGESPAAAGQAASAVAGQPNDEIRACTQPIDPAWTVNDDGTLSYELKPKLAAAAAYGLHEWINGEVCDAPTYFRSIASDLERLSK